MAGFDRLDFSVSISACFVSLAAAISMFCLSVMLPSDAADKVQDGRVKPATSRKGDT